VEVERRGLLVFRELSVARGVGAGGEEDEGQRDDGVGGVARRAVGVSRVVVRNERCQEVVLLRD
jgi:hypothetical protein